MAAPCDCEGEISETTVVRRRSAVRSGGAISGENVC